MPSYLPTIITNLNDISNPQIWSKYIYVHSLCPCLLTKFVVEKGLHKHQSRKIYVAKPSPLAKMSILKSIICIFCKTERYHDMKTCYLHKSFGDWFFFCILIPKKTKCIGMYNNLFMSSKINWQNTNVIHSKFIWKQEYFFNVFFVSNTWYIIVTFQRILCVINSSKYS